MKKNKLDFTVVIPTYNGALRLPKILQSLKFQLNIRDIFWEVIVVDNNSTDNTREVIKRYQEQWPKEYPLRYCFESCQGAAFARQKGAEEAKGDFIGFLDDDSWVAPNWIKEAVVFGREYSQAGTWSSRVFAEFEEKPFESFEKIAIFFAINTSRGSEPLQYKAQKLVLPASLGLVVRKKAWPKELPFLKGRTKHSWLAGEDMEIALRIQRQGWELWYNPKMEIYHKIPSVRLKKSYLLPFFRGFGIGSFIIRKQRFKPWQRPFGILAYMIHDLYKIIKYIVKERGKIKIDLASRCILQLYIYNLISPLYFLKTKTKDGESKKGVT